MNKPKQRGSSKVLTDDELKALLDVPTTVEDARTILKRNKLALKYLRLHDGRLHTVAVGCPHCINAAPGSSYYACGDCAYNAHSTFKHHEPHSMSCLHYTFGGFSLSDVQEKGVLMALSKFHMDVHAQVEEHGELPERLAARAAAERFLLGHIEWAKEVIRRARARRGGAG